MAKKAFSVPAIVWEKVWGEVLPPVLAVAVSETLAIAI
jgi:hypothetical protein